MEMFAASQLAERLEESDRLMEMILERYNIILAWKRVCANKGTPSVMGSPVPIGLKYSERI